MVELRFSPEKEYETKRKLCINVNDSFFDLTDPVNVSKPLLTVDKVKINPAKGFFKKAIS